MRPINEIFMELQQHPDYISGVIWTVDDLKHTLIMQEADASFENVTKFASFIDMNGWEDVAIQDGWEVVVQQYYSIFGEGE